MKLSRRSWIKIAAGGIGILFASGGLVWLDRKKFLKVHSSSVESYLRQNFDYLLLDVSKQEFKKFYQSFTEHYGQIPALRWYLRVGHRNKVATTFLLSTDFFLNGADESKKVRYVRLYNQYASPCWNPISTAAAQNQASS